MLITSDGHGTYITVWHGHHVAMRCVCTDTWVLVINGRPASTPYVNLAAAMHAARTVISSSTHTHDEGYRPNVTQQFTCCQAS